MIINATTGKGFSETLSYINKEFKELAEEKQPVILVENNVFGTVLEQAQMMYIIARRNARSSNPVLHLSISFHHEERIEENPELRDLIFTRILDELGANEENHQYVIAQHFDADHEHYHIVLNKVGLDRSNINTSYIKNKCQVIADKLEQELGLRRTYGRTIVYDPSSETKYRYTRDDERNKKNVFLDKAPNIRTTKQDLKDAIDLAMDSSSSVKEFVSKLGQQQIDIDAKYNFEDKLIGISFRYNNQSYSGTKLGVKSKFIQSYFDSKPQKQEHDHDGGEGVDISATPEDPQPSTQPEIVEVNDEVKEVVTADDETTLNTQEPEAQENKATTISIPEVPHPAPKSKFTELEDRVKDIGLKIENTDENTSEYLDFNSKFKNSCESIIKDIKRGNVQIEELLLHFHKKGVVLNDTNTIECKDFKFMPLEWIEKCISNYNETVREFKVKDAEYQELMVAKKKSIPFYKGKIKKNELKSFNEDLVFKQKNTPKPILEFISIEQPYSAIQELQKLLSNLSLLRERLRSELLKAREEEREYKLNLKSKELLTEESKIQYVKSRGLFNEVEEYEEDLRDLNDPYQQIKDLKWLDQKFISLVSPEEQLEFIKNEFGLDEQKSQNLCNYFLSKDAEITEIKFAYLNSLSDRLIRKDERIEISTVVIKQNKGIKL